MKKVFTSLMTLVLLCVVSLSAQAQETTKVPDLDTKLITSVEQLYSNQDHNTINPSATDGQGLGALIDGNDETFWHSAWKNNDATIGSHYLQVELASDPGEFAFGFKRRNNSGNQITKFKVIGYTENNPELGKTDGVVLGEVPTPFASQTETIISPIMETKGCKVIRFYCESTSGNGAFWHAAEFQVYPSKSVSARDVALENLGNIYGEYSAQAENFPAGTTPGKYDAAKVEAFLNALEAAGVVDGPMGASLTADEINKLAQDILDTYEAMAASRVPFAMAITPGYYFLRAGMPYFTTETTPDSEDPETGEPIPGETITTYHKKAMYADGTSAKWGELDETNVKYLWKVEAVADTTLCYNVTNMAKNYQFTKTIGTLGAEGAPVSFDYAGTTQNDMWIEGDVTYFNIRLTTAKERQGTVYFHQNQHSAGAGKGSGIVGWYTTFDEAETKANASEWVLIPVDEALAQELINGPAAKVAEMLDNAATIVEETPAQMTIAKDITTKVDTDKPAITEWTQFSSPMKTYDAQKKDGVAIDNDEDYYKRLLDGDNTTYFHTAWEGGDQTPGTHYLQVEVADLSTVAFVMTRRPVANDHVSIMSVYGYAESNEELSKEDGTLLGTYDFGYKNNTEVLTSGVFDATGCKALRFYAEETRPIAYNRGYWHCSEFQIYPATVSQYYADGTSQYNANKTVAETLEAAVAAWTAKGYTADNVSLPDEEPFASDYAALVAAKEAWAAVYVNPSDLRDAITAASAAVENVSIGNKVGQYSADNAALAALNSSVASATAYDKAGKYNAEKNEELIAALATTELATTCNQPKAGVWYKIKYDSKENFEAHGWSTTPAVNANLGDLFDNVVAPANVVENVLESVDEPSMGQTLRFIDEGSVDEEVAAFRFVALGDTAYAIQHTSGYYISPAKTLSLTPAIFDVRAAGLGKALIHVRNIDGTEQNNGGSPSFLHAQNAGHVLVGWATSEVQSSSALLIEEADVDGDPINPSLAVNPNGLRIMTQAIGWTVDDGDLYEVAGRKTEGESQVLCFTKVEKAEAGLPYLHVMGDYEDEADEDQTGDDTVELTTDLSTIAPTAGSKNGMYGTYSYTWIEPERDDVVVVVAREHYATRYGYKLATTKSVDPEGDGPYDSEGNEGCDVSANTGYIVLSEVPVVEGSYDLEITVDGANSETAIKQIASALAKAGNIYTIDGRYLGKGSVKNLGRGIYVVNGVKVAVK